MKNSDFTLGYDLDDWHYYGERTPIVTDISSDTTSHALICGASGSGKSYFQAQFFARLVKAEPDGEFYFADYKRDDSFAHLRGCTRYYPHKRTLDALDALYNRMNARMSGEDETRNPVTLIWDEYIANVLSLLNEDKKKAEVVMNKVSEILMDGRSMSIRLVISTQRPDAKAFPDGSRINCGIIVVLGAYKQSVYKVALPEYMDEVKGRKFRRGEGSVWLERSGLHYIKVPQMRDIEAINDVCVGALS